MAKNPDKYYDMLAKFYDSFFIQFLYSPAHNQNIKIVKELIKGKERILDIGCGTGNFLNKIRKINEKIDLFGIDQSQEMIKIAKKKFTNINFFASPADRLPFENNYFDLIAIIDAFYCFEDKDRVISECRRVLKEKSYLFIYTPSVDDFLSKLFIALTKISPTETKSRHLYSAELKNIAKKNGLDIIFLKKSFFPFTPLKYWSLVLIKN